MAAESAAFSSGRKPTNPLIVACPWSLFSIPVICLSSQYARQPASTNKLTDQIEVKTSPDGAIALRAMLGGQAKAAFATIDAWAKLTEDQRTSCSLFCAMASGSIYTRYVNHEIPGAPIKTLLKKGIGSLVYRKGTVHEEIAVRSFIASNHIPVGSLLETDVLDLESIRGIQNALGQGISPQNNKKLPLVILGLPGWVHKVVNGIDLPANLKSFPAKDTKAFGSLKHHIFVRNDLDHNNIRTLRELMHYLVSIDSVSLGRLFRTLNDKAQSEIVSAEYSSTNIDRLIFQYDVRFEVKCLEPSSVLDMWNREIRKWECVVSNPFDTI